MTNEHEFERVRRAGAIAVTLVSAALPLACGGGDSDPGVASSHDQSTNEPSQTAPSSADPPSEIVEEPETSEPLREPEVVAMDARPFDAGTPDDYADAPDACLYPGCVRG